MPEVLRPGRRLSGSVFLVLTTTTRATGSGKNISGARKSSPRSLNPVTALILGALVTVGWFAGYAAFLASGEMAAAYFIGHFPHSFWPLQNQGEEAVFYCFVFLYMATKGAGIWSIDGVKEKG